MSRRAFDDVLVRFSAGTHTTSTVRGERSSSTASYEAAARDLGWKLHGAYLIDAQRIKQVPTVGAEHWRITYTPGQPTQRKGAT